MTKNFFWGGGFEKNKVVCGPNIIGGVEVVVGWGFLGGGGPPPAPPLFEVNLYFKVWQLWRRGLPRLNCQPYFWNWSAVYCLQSLTQGSTCYCSTDRNWPTPYGEKQNKRNRIIKKPPNPGIEPGPPGWKPGILTTRPIGNWYDRTWSVPPI